MRRSKTPLATLLMTAILLTACNGIEKTGLDAGSAPVVLKAEASRSVSVSRSEAAGIAEAFLRTDAGGGMVATKSSDAQSKRVSTTATVREDGQDLMYVFNYDGGGFVIVGSTRNYYPILAYSDKGSFVLQDDMGPVDVWLDETKVSIKNSGSLDETTKVQMQQLWARYDGTYVDPAQEIAAARRPQTRSTGEDYCWARIEALQAQYGSDGWTFTTVSGAEQIFEDAGLSSYYDDICYSAAQNHSALNETVIGYKNAPIYQSEGPFLSSEWHQGYPYNYLCQGNCAAGCATVAIAQVMRSLPFPNNPGGLSWNNIPCVFDEDVYPPIYQHPQLIMLVRQHLGLTGTDASSSNSDIYDALETIGFNPTMDDHNDQAVRNEIFNHRRPVIMTGYKIASGHCWVCDGAEENIYDQITFYTENQPYGAGMFTQGMYTYTNPGIVGGIVCHLYHRNWGWSDTDFNGWYTSNNLADTGQSGNYQYLRKDFYISVTQ